jgi:hypothetical protein
MLDSTDKLPFSPLRLVAIALISAMAFAAVMVPLHRVLHAPPLLEQKSLVSAQQAQAAASEQATRDALTRQETGTFSLQDNIAHQQVSHEHTSPSPFGHQAGQECDNWNAVFGADTLSSQSFGTLGPDAVTARRIAPIRETPYTRLSSSPHLARGPPRC